MTAVSITQRTLFGLTLAVMLCTAHGGESTPPTAPATGSVTASSGSALTAHSTELMELAFAVASAIPAEPHIKDRSRAQQEVVDALIRLGAWETASSYAGRIGNWRRGMAYADLAFVYAEVGKIAEVQDYLIRANLVEQTENDWRRDRIRVRMAQTHALLGQLELADEMEKGVAQGEGGKVRIVRARKASSNDAEGQIGALDAVAANGDLDSVRSALAALIELYERFYDTPEIRARLEASIQSAATKAPVIITIETMLRQCAIARAHGDNDSARARLEKVESIISEVRWPAEAKPPVLAKVAVERHRLGETERAELVLTDAVKAFEVGREQIILTDRAGALRPVAAAYQTIGDAARASNIYGRVLEEGGSNANARPRALDLSATLVSMAESGFVVDEPTLVRIKSMKEALGSPW